jgi:hypothetical protein
MRIIVLLLEYIRRVRSYIRAFIMPRLFNITDVVDPVASSDDEEEDPIPPMAFRKEEEPPQRRGLFKRILTFNRS